MANIRDIVMKVKALAERGDEGERVNAEKLLRKMCDKYNISLDDLDTEKRTERTFKTEKAYGNLLTQIIVKVSGQIVYKARSVHNTLIAEVTEYEYMEIMCMYDFYKKIVRKELEVFEYAFYVKHNLFSTRKREEKEQKELTPKERAKARKAYLMAIGMSDAEYQKRLE